MGLTLANDEGPNKQVCDRFSNHSLAAKSMKALPNLLRKFATSQWKAREALFVVCFILETLSWCWNIYR
jgi:hypothetical protein